MSSVKESLRNTIESLSNEEARQVLEFAERLRESSNASLTPTQLASNPAFKVPPEGSGVFRVVEPIQGRGVDASKLLIEERR